jgi:dihydrodipicolinate synthase/N-acetylneuraminate lyase
MNTAPLDFAAIASSVWAVPPLARKPDLALAPDENRKIIRHIEAGGVRLLLYGGNANFYSIPLSEYAATLEFLCDAAGPETWVVPSAGPDYGRLLDQAEVLRALPFPAVMCLPASGPATQTGIETALRRFAERLGRPITLYLKSEGYLQPEAVGRLATDGLLCAIKYAVVRADPGQDDYLRALLDALDPRYLISGMGELPALVHLRDFGLAGFTSGSVCVGPRGSTAMLAALQAGDYEQAERLRAAYLPLEHLRNTIHPIRVLHAALALARIADTGPILPLLHNLDEADRPAVQAAARELLARDRALQTND